MDIRERSLYKGRMEAELDALKELIRFQFSDGNAANQLLERGLSERQKNVRKPHCFERSTGYSEVLVY